MHSHTRYSTNLYTLPYCASNKSSFFNFSFVTPYYFNHMNPYMYKAVSMLQQFFPFIGNQNSLTLKPALKMKADVLWREHWLLIQNHLRPFSFKKYERFFIVVFLNLIFRFYPRKNFSSSLSCRSFPF